ncbi:methylenetetrahydrofolate reductase (NAD(P)H) met13 [Elasticomyces elasticus]|nr:methylenetetrahydrofolate reductase (NAD(P)H) met13 [Elasticomyces elasticus]KAK3618282.1 methylenetetrahydrofolate reductase (NAD(P)H) met13 [Elasticomyces elasticus]KAK4903613.1 methylenetetrahydrofolate reductase (NAD(P)H) met13 [Elasticomyces elasticus]
MAQIKVDEALNEEYKVDGTNILALRGPPPREEEKWEQAGYPEGCDEETDADAHILYLLEKVEAGRTFVVAQTCYDADVFIE